MREPARLEVLERLGVRLNRRDETIRTRLYRRRRLAFRIPNRSGDAEKLEPREPRALNDLDQIVEPWLDETDVQVRQ